jgi:hypothetical protein
VGELTPSYEEGGLVFFRDASGEPNQAWPVRIAVERAEQPCEQVHGILRKSPMDITACRLAGLDQYTRSFLLLDGYGPFGTGHVLSCQSARSGTEPLEPAHDREELAEPHELIKRGLHQDAIERIEFSPVRTLLTRNRLTIERTSLMEPRANGGSDHIEVTPAVISICTRTRSSAAAGDSDRLTRRSRLGDLWRPCNMGWIEPPWISFGIEVGRGLLTAVGRGGTRTASGQRLKGHGSRLNQE